MLQRPASNDFKRLFPVRRGVTPRCRGAILIAAAIYLLGGLGWIASIAADRNQPISQVLFRVIPGTYHLERLVEPEHPVIARWASAITAITPDPRMQISLAEATIERNVVYCDDNSTWGAEEYEASPTDIEALRVRRGWRDAREDCDGRAVMLASLLRKLDFSARIKEGRSTPAAGGSVQHAWVEVDLNGTLGSLLDLRDNMKLPDYRPLAENPTTAPHLEQLKLLSWNLRELDHAPDPGPSRVRWRDLALISVAMVAALLLWDLKTARPPRPAAERQGREATVGNGLSVGYAVRE